MTQQERADRLKELREELKSADRFRSRDAIIIEGRALRIAFDLYKAHHPEDTTKLGY